MEWEAENADRMDWEEPRTHKASGSSGFLTLRFLTDLNDGTLPGLRDIIKLPTCEVLRRRTLPSSIVHIADDLPANHDFLAILSQSSRKASSEGVAAGSCRHCNYFVVVTAGHGAEKRVCGYGRQHPLHHLVLNRHASSVTRPPTDPTQAKYFPRLGLLEFECSSLECTYKVTVEVVAPRFLSQARFINLICDFDRARRRMADATRREPARYADVSPTLYCRGPVFLHHYIHDVLVGPLANSKLFPPKILHRNKNFLITLGLECRELLEYLEFDSRWAEDDGGASILPDVGSPPADGVTAATSRRAFFEAVKSELRWLIRRLKLSDLDSDVEPNDSLSLRESLEMVLDTPSKFWVLDLPKLDDQGQDFCTLGVPPGCSDALLRFAYTCQRQTDPENRPAYLAALTRLARNQRGVDLEVMVQTEASKLEAEETVEKRSRNRLYDYFSLPPDADDQVVINKFKAMCSSAPRQDYDHRIALMKIARHRGNEALQAAAYQMNYEEALNCLGVTPSMDSESIVAQVTADEADNVREKILACRALLVISENREHPWCIDEYTTRLTEDIPGIDKNGSLLGRYNYQNATQFKRLSTFGDSTFGESDNDHDMTLQDHPGPQADQPVGLTNLRNTCYLNSILQYFHTVKPVRDLVLDWDKHRLQHDNEEAVKARRIGGVAEQLDSGTALVAHAFMNELRDLYSEFSTTRAKYVRPKQRLANAALLSARSHMEELERQRKLQQEAAAARPFGPEPAPTFDPRPLPSKDLALPPPLPARPSLVPPLCPSRRSGSMSPIVRVASVSGSTDRSDEASDRTSETLVCQVEGMADVTYEQAAPHPSTELEPQQDSPEAPTDAKAGTSVAFVTAPGPTASPEPDVVVMDSASAINEEAALLKALADQTVSGSNQEDVEEVMGKCITHFHAAIKPTSVDSPSEHFPHGLQWDQIMETFYLENVSYTANAGSVTQRPEFSRWIQAPPAEDGPRDLYSAIDFFFDHEFIGINNEHERYMTIKRAPPILHICIPRSTDGRRKNQNIVRFPDVIHLDRYMDAPKDSTLHQTRELAWSLKRRLRSLDEEAKRQSSSTLRPKPQPSAAAKKADTQPAPQEDSIISGTVLGAFIGGYDPSTKQCPAHDEMDIDPADNSPARTGHATTTTTPDGEDPDAIIELQEDITILPPPSRPPSSSNPTSATVCSCSSTSSSIVMVPHSQSPEAGPSQAAAENSAKKEANSNADQTKSQALSPKAVRTNLESQLSQIFQGDTNEAYRLHAVICHGGTASNAGHYWVWIYDFDASVWRKYNDSTVTVEPDDAAVHRSFATGDPYYLAYVRDSIKQGLVQVPPRAAASTETDEPQDYHQTERMPDANMDPGHGAASNNNAPAQGFAIWEDQPVYDAAGRAFGGKGTSQDIEMLDRPFASPQRPPDSINGNDEDGA